MEDGLDAISTGSREEEPDSTSHSGSQSTPTEDNVTVPVFISVGGQKRKDRRTESVWQFFEQVDKGVRCKTCKVELSGRVSSSMRKHLRTKHPILHSETVEVKKGDGSQGHPLIKKFCVDRNAAAMDWLIDLFSQTTISTSLVEAPQFRGFAESLSFKPPCVKSLKTEVKKRFEDGRTALKKRLLAANGLSLTTDLWTNKGLSKSFIAVTAHFVDEPTGKLVTALLDMVPIKDRHYAEVVRGAVDTVLMDYDLSLEKITAVITDNGANVVKAFTDEDEYQLNETEGSDDEDVTNGDVDVNHHGALFDIAEDEFDVIVMPKRLSCVIHTMQLVLKKIVTDVLDADGRVDSILLFVRNFRHSSTCMRELLTRSGLTLVLPSRTRWNYIYYVFRRLVVVWDKLQDVCSYLEREALPSRDLVFVNKVLDIMKPYEEFTRKMELETDVTISHVFPFIKSQLLYLEKRTKDEVSIALSRELKTRFKFGTSEFDERYLISTYLDPVYDFALNPLEQAEVERMITAVARKPISDDVEEVQLVDEMCTPSQDRSNVPSFCRDLLEDAANMRHALSGAASDKDILRKELDIYRKERTKFVDQSALDFWASQEQVTMMPKLREVALRFLSVPASSASSERTFSLATIFSTGRRNRVSDGTLRTRTFLAMNSKFLSNC